MEWKVELVLVAGVVGLLVAGCATAHPTMAPAGVDLRGSWVLDTAASGGPGLRGRPGQSDRPGRPGARGVRGGRAGGFGRPQGGFGGGMRGGRGGMGGRPDPQRMARMRAAMRELMPLANRVDVLEADTLVRVDWGDGRMMSLVTNGKKRQETWGDVEVAEKAKWSDGALLLERKADGVTVEERWVRNPGTKRLTVDVKVSGAFPRALHFVRVYNLEDGGS